MKSSSRGSAALGSKKVVTSGFSGLLSGLRLRGGHGVGLRLRQEAADAPPRYLAQVKTDCLLTQRLPKRFAERLRALEALRHPDGTPVYRVEETKPLLSGWARPKQRRWNGVDDPISHCLAGNSLLLTGLPGTGKTHLARTIVARLREQGEAVHLVSKTHCSAQNLGLGAQTADHWVRRYAGHGALGGPGLRGAER